MKNIIFYISIILSCQNCQPDQEKSDKVIKKEKPIEVLKTKPKDKTEIKFNIERHLANYQNLKTRISEYQKSVRNRNDIEKEEKFELAEKYISKILIDSIFEYWLRTEWDFNGHTDKPRKGEIACGYFITTTLKDVGIKLNRYKIAQKAASEIIYELCDNNSIEKISSLSEVERYLENIENDVILIVGLDFHVGFIFKRGNKNYFAHSNYIDRKGVEIELFKNSAALRNSEIYVIGNFSENKKMLENWLK